jgi:hypothetical protein
LETLHTDSCGDTKDFAGRFVIWNRINLAGLDCCIHFLFHFYPSSQFRPTLSIQTVFATSDLVVIFWPPWSQIQFLTIFVYYHCDPTTLTVVGKKASVCICLRHWVSSIRGLIVKLIIYSFGGQV